MPVVNGTSNNDELLGTDEPDSISGFAGDDLLNGGAGLDTLDGGPGDDVYVLEKIVELKPEFTAVSGVSAFTGPYYAAFNHWPGIDQLQIDAIYYSQSSALYYGLGSFYNEFGSFETRWFSFESSASEAVELSIGDEFFNSSYVDQILPDAGGIDLVRSSLDDYTLGNTLENLELIGNENINGSGNSLANVMIGNSGANILSGHGGNDVLDGGGGADVMRGGIGDDTYHVDIFQDTIEEEIGGGIDTVLSSSAYYVLDANVENAKIISADVAGVSGNSLDNLIFAGAGDNEIDGAGGVDTVSYADGFGVSIDLRITGSQSTGGSGSDRLINIENLVGSSFSDSLTGNSGNNTLDGGSGFDTLRGDGGDDVIIAEGGYSAALVWSSAGHSTDEFGNPIGFDTYYYVGETIDGGEGSDSVRYDSSPGRVIVNLSSGYGYSTEAVPYLDSLVTSLVNSNGDFISTVEDAIFDFADRLVSIENVVGSGFGDELIGNSSANVLNGGAGADMMIGGDGSDSYYVDNAGDSVSESNATTSVGGIDTVYSYLASYVLGANIEQGRILATGTANLTGNSLANTLFAGSGNNVLNGGAGVDSLSYVYAGSAVTVSLAVTTAQATGGSGTDTLLGIENLTGSNYNDRLTGSSAANVLNGGKGADTMIGGDGSDIYYVENAGDIVSETNATASTGGTDTVYSYVAAYTLTANVEQGRILSTGAANLTGNSLANTLFAGSGNNVLNGGAGVDTASYAYASSAITVSLAVASAQATGGSGADTLVSIENLMGSNYGDRLTGSAGANVLNGGTGADTLIGGDGSDTYYVDNAGDLVVETNSSASTGGSDLVYSNLATYTLGANVEQGRVLATGSANLTGNSLANTLFAGSGNNVLNGGAGVDTGSYAYAGSAVTASLALTTAQATGGSGTDTLLAIENLTGSNYNDRLTGSSAANVLNGGKGADTLVGGDGSDTYHVDNAGDLVVETNANAGTGGTDTVYSYLATYTLGANVEQGRVLATGTANLTGNGLVNTLFAGSGNNVLNGGAGVDTASYAYAGSAVVASLAVTTAQATGGSGSDTLLAIENLTGSNYNDRLTGSSAANVLNGGKGADTMAGGNGADIYYVDNSGDIVSETNTSAASGGIDTVYSYLAAYTLGANVEQGRILATGGANLTGNSLANTLFAGSGNNVLNGGAGSDIASYLYASGAVTASLALTTAQATGGSGTDTLLAIENLTGSNYNDRLTGSSAANVLNGGKGADTLVGGDGSDIYYVDNVGDLVVETNANAGTGGTDTVYSYVATYTLGANVEQGRILATGTANLTGNGLVNTLFAGSGNNVLNGGAGVDTASYAYAGSAVVANLAVTTAQATGGSGSDTLLAIENLVGSSFNDRLTGSSTANSLNGGAGNDLLVGGHGRDVLTGGSGNDIFDFNALGETGRTNTTWDVITDFTRGADKIDLSTLDANAATTLNDAFTGFIGSTAAFTQAGQLKLAGGVLYGNVDADSDAEFAIQLTGISTLSTADLIV